MTNNNADVMEVAEWYLDLVLKDYYMPLAKSLEKNCDKISFITDGIFIPRDGRYNYNCKDQGKIIKSQCDLFSSFIDSIDRLQTKALSEDSQQRIFFAAMLLKPQAIKLGYCKEAEGLLKIVANPQLVGGFALTDEKEDVLQILSNYGKRSILENGKSYNNEVEEVVKEVCNGAFGHDTNRALSVEQMRDAYNKATVTMGDAVFKMDGSVEKVENSKV